MFRIDDTDFKVDLKKSKFKLRILKDGSATINANIYGNKEKYALLTEDESSRWSWTLYPPHFYLHDFPAKVAGAQGKATAQVTVDDLDEHEAALYMMEHNDIDEVSIMINESTFSAKGIVFLSGRPHPFSIKFKKA